MKTKRTPLRQSPKKSEGGFENRPEKAVDRNSPAPRGRAPRGEAAEGRGAPVAPAPRRKPAPNNGGRANRGAIARDGRPLAEAKPERLQKVLAQAGIGSRREKVIVATMIRDSLHPCGFGIEPARLAEAITLDATFRARVRDEPALDEVRREGFEGL